MSWFIFLLGIAAALLLVQLGLGVGERVPEGGPGARQEVYVVVTVLCILALTLAITWGVTHFPLPAP